MKKTIAFGGLFLFTLLSHTIYVWGIGLVLLIVFLILENTRIKKVSANESKILFILLILSLIRFYYFLIDDVNPLFISGLFGNVARYLLLIVSWLILRTLLLEKRTYKKIITTIPILLYLHISAFYIQFIIYILSNTYLDFVEPFTGEESRYSSFGTFKVIGSIRPTGFYIEPSTYFAGILPLVVLLFIHFDVKKYYSLISLSLLSMYLSFSTAAIIIATLLVFYVISKYNLSWKFYLFTTIFILGIFSYSASSFTNIIDAQSNKFDQSSIKRFELINYIIERPLINNLMGSGALALDKTIVYSSTFEGADNSISSINDAGLLVFLSLRFGIIGIVYFIILAIIQYRIRSENLIFFILISLTKLNIFTPLFILYFALSMKKEPHNELSKYKLEHV